MQRKKRLRSRELTSHLQRHASEKAAAEARRVPWQVLLEARNQYLDWQEFYHWARSIIDVEHAIPDWLERKLDEACPGFLAAEKQYLRKPAKEADLASVRLGQWIDERIFGFAKQERLIGFFYYCLRLGWIKSNPAVRLGRIRADGPPTNYFPVVEHVKKSADEDSC